eukprot:366157-Chlamydomonas_euryale.AAC.24
MGLWRLRHRSGWGFWQRRRWSGWGFGIEGIAVDGALAEKALQRMGLWRCRGPSHPTPGDLGLEQTCRHRRVAFLKPPDERRRGCLRHAGVSLQQPARGGGFGCGQAVNQENKC